MHFFPHFGAVTFVLSHLKNSTLKFLKIFSLILALAFVGACGSEEPTNERKRRPKPKKKVVTDLGEKLFKNKCVICHGINGDLQFNGAKNIQESLLTLEDRINLIDNGKGLMTPFKGILSDEEMKAVAEYSMKLTKKAE